MPSPAAAARAASRAAIQASRSAMASRFIETS
jgi:hypothetical protein